MKGGMTVRLLCWQNQLIRNQKVPYLSQSIANCKWVDQCKLPLLLCNFVTPDVRCKIDNKYQQIAVWCSRREKTICLLTLMDNTKIIETREGRE